MGGISVFFLSGYSRLEGQIRAKEKNKFYGAKRELKEPDVLIWLQNNQNGNFCTRKHFRLRLVTKDIQGYSLTSERTQMAW